MTRSAVQHGTMQAPRGNQRIVLLAVAGALAFAALPFVSKQVLGTLHLSRLVYVSKWSRDMMGSGMMCRSVSASKKLQI